MPDVSIIIPTYNRAALLSGAIDSALAQGERYEVIVVDDGSTDDTAALLAGYGDRIRVLRQANKGPSAARNLAAEAARGDYLFFADSDDLIEPSAVGRLLDEARLLGPTKIPFGEATTIDEAGRPVEAAKYGFGSVRRGEELDFAGLLSGTMPLWLTLLPAALFRRLGGLRPGLRLGEDQEFAVRVHAAGLRYVATEVPTINVRIHDAPRLSGTANREFGSRAVQLWSAITEEVAAVPEFDLHARQAMEEAIWVAARDAARARDRVAAERLFAMAQAIDGGVVRTSPLPLRLLSQGVGAYRAERGAELVKRLLGRR
ncbi:glycosyltransferase family 2 protein [Sphingomonas sp. LHG3443-2]|uniref:glycosyltransferase family 2 protein n=1 Tax=Sphingomonas sp. LHG3443-2 TaxID=2804639 RepID=UPI003CF6E8CF